MLDKVFTSIPLPSAWQGKAWLAPQTENSAVSFLTEGCTAGFRYKKPDLHKKYQPFQQAVEGQQDFPLGMLCPLHVIICILNRWGVKDTTVTDHSDRQGRLKWIACCRHAVGLQRGKCLCHDPACHPTVPLLKPQVFACCAWPCAGRLGGHSVPALSLAACPSHVECLSQRSSSLFF